MLEAKFVSETATGVGPSTTLVTANRDGVTAQMPSEEIAKIKQIWKEAQRQPIPSDALAVISSSKVVKKISDGER